jgi:Zn ribbon nucleic-acid-binding protein
MTCRLCAKGEAIGPGGMCPRCRRKYGVPERWPESRRLPRPCVRCGHPQLIRAIIRERGASSWHSPGLAALGVTFRRVIAISISGDARPLNEPDLREPAGILEVYACRACGYSEWYVLEPERVPIGPEYATELLDAGAGSPDR